MTTIRLDFICTSDRCAYFKQTRTRPTWSAHAEAGTFSNGVAKLTLREGSGKCAYCKRQGEAR